MIIRGRTRNIRLRLTLNRKQQIWETSSETTYILAHYIYILHILFNRKKLLEIYGIACSFANQNLIKQSIYNIHCAIIVPDLIYNKKKIDSSDIIRVLVHENQ